MMILTEKPDYPELSSDLIIKAVRLMKPHFM